ncbi:MAG: hypothetical protein Q7S63_01210 [bacterium]|nr:hypothetical protein [bacterium]
MKTHQNTIHRGSVRCIVFREDSVWYAVGLELNIVESGDTPREAFMLLTEAIQGYVESARKIKARPSILNQKTDSEYETMWLRAQESKLGQKPKEDIFFAGRLNISQAMGRSLIAA